MNEQEIYQHIEMNPLRGREPVFRGTNITIKHIIDDLAKGKSVEEILAEHQELSKNHLRAAFVYMKNTLEEIEDLRLSMSTGIPPFWRLLFRSRKG